MFDLQFIKSLVGAIAAVPLVVVAMGAHASFAAEPTEKLPERTRLFMWTQPERVVGNRNMMVIFPSDEFANDPNHIRPMPKGALLNAVSYRFGNKLLTLDDFIQRQNVTGLLVVKNGSIVLERYTSGNDEHTRWNSWSVGKSIVSTLIGIALKQGRIGSLDEPITKYVPELSGTAYEGVSIRNMMQMSSGLKWSENPADPPPTVVQFAGCLIAQEPGCTLALAKTLTRAVDAKTNTTVKPGAAWNYSNVDAFVTGVMLQRATGKSLAKYMEEQIWKPYGMESSGFWSAESKGGLSSGAGDFSATLRDYGRFAQFILDNGVLPNGTKTLPEGWVAEATTWGPYTGAAAANANLPQGRYGYFWWHIPVTPGIGAAPETTPTSDSTFSAVGLFGQYIFINPKEKLIMVQWSAYPTPGLADPSVETATLFNAISTALH